MYNDKNNISGNILALYSYMIANNTTYVGAKRVGTAGEHGIGNASTPIHLSNLQCTGNESEIYQCNGNEQPTDCTHNNDVSVECLRKL